MIRIDCQHLLSTVWQSQSRGFLVNIDLQILSADWILCDPAEVNLVAPSMWHSEEDEIMSCVSDTDMIVIILSDDQCLFDHKASETVCDEDNGNVIFFL